MSMLQRITTASNSYSEGWYWASDRFLPKTVAADADRYKLLSPTVMQVDVGGISLTNTEQQTLDLSLDTNWDHGQSIGTWTANTAYEVGDLVRPTAAWLADGANNASVSYATSAMLSNTIPGPCVVSADSIVNSDFKEYLAFNGILDASYAWISAATAPPHWIKFDFGENRGKVITKFCYQQYNSGKRWKFQGSNVASPGTAIDSSDWVTLLDNTGSDVAQPNWGDWSPYFTFSNSTAYRHYRLYNTVTWASDGLSVGYREIKLVSTPSLVYRCTVAGTSHATTHPTMPIAEGSTVTESGSTLQWTAYLDNTVASNRAGLDSYVYACTPTSGTVPKLLVSKHSTYPLGYTASNSRKICGFHCECADIGTNTYGGSAHSLYNYLQGDILPASVWDLRWKSNSLIGNVGQVYDASRQIWVGIYFPSGTAGSPTIVYGGTILVSTDWNDVVDAGAVLGMRLSKNSEFQSLAIGSNEQTVISGAAIPTTVAGAVDSAGIRMVSNIGVEGACGQLWQWLDEQGYRFDAATAHTHGWTVDGSAQSNVVSAAASGDLAPVWDWYNLPLDKGQLYRQGTYGSTKLVGGGAATTTAGYCGSRGCDAMNWPWTTSTGITARFVARHIVKEFI